MLFRQFNIYFHQFGLINSIRFLCSTILRKIFDPYAIYSYSQTGEDRIIEAILGHPQNKFFVDVGCNHPQWLSNTFALYKKGWRGINIDGNEKIVNLYHNLRSEDKNIQAFISDQSSEILFTEFKDSAVSSLSPDHVEKWRAHSQIVSQKMVQTSTLTEILELYQSPKRFDLLSIDVEGHDYEVLSSLDLNVYRPRLIVIEMHDFDINQPSQHPIYQYLTGKSYQLAGFVIMNGYFVDQSGRKPE
jgi:FkbM family methyltransferase